jgi:putative ABC transport system permease protein
MNRLWEDAAYSLRTLARTPGFTAIAILTLALGIGANTVIFSVVYAVLLRPLPYPRAGELVSLHESLPPNANRPARTDMPNTPPTTRDWAAASSFANIAFYAEGEYILTGAGEPDRIAGANVSHGFFDTLGTAPSAGRFFSREDDSPGGPLVCVIAYDLWRTRFGADPAIVGRSIGLEGRMHSVIGVARSGFAFPEGAQVWMPLALPESEFADDQRMSFYLDGIGRLKRGVTSAAAAADLTLIANQLAVRFPKMYSGRGATVAPLQESITAGVRPALLLLLGTVACVLLIACVNVASLLLVRGAAREPEMATRAALGASRRRIMQQLLTETSLLALAGAGGGVILAMWARDSMVGLTPPDVPRITEVHMNPPVLGFALALATLSVVVCGIAPAFWASRKALASSLAAAGRKGATGAARPRIRAALVVGQLALSLALLTGAGLLARAFWKLTSVDPGFSPDNVMTMEVMLPRAKYPEPAQRAEFFNQVVELLQANPVVKAAGGSTNLPLSRTNMSFGFYREEMNPQRDAPFFANVRGITSGYFEALSIPLIRGRRITAADRVGSTPVVVINDALRRKFWPDGDPIGQKISITRGRTVVWREIVGIVGDIRHANLAAPPEPEIYMPYAHDPFFFLRIAVRSDAPRDALAGAMRAAVWAVDPAQPVARLRPMREVIAASIASQRFNAVLIGAFASLALVLAAVGLYGVIAYSVALRHHEFGVRIALGAGRRDVIRLVLGQALTLSVAGLAAGLALAWLSVRAIENQLYGVTPTDPVTLGGVAAILLAIALTASYVPARRAMRVDPMTALRAE